MVDALLGFKRISDGLVQLRRRENTWWRHDGETPATSLAVCEENHQGAVSIRKTVLPGMAIPMLKIRRPNGRLIFNMEIAIRR